MKLHLSIENHSGQHLEAFSAPLDWCHHLHSLKSWCDVYRQFWLGSILQLQGIGFFIATYMQDIQTVSPEMIAHCLSFSTVTTPCGHTSCMDWEHLNSQRQGVLPFPDLQGTLPSCSTAWALQKGWTYSSFCLKDCHFTEPLHRDRVYWGSLDFHYNRIIGKSGFCLLSMCLPFGYDTFLRQTLHRTSL